MQVGYLPIERIKILSLTALSLQATSILELCSEAEGLIAQLVFEMTFNVDSPHVHENALIEQGKELLMRLVRIREPQLESLVEVIPMLTILPGPTKMLTFTYTYKAEIASLVANNVGVRYAQ